jgi:hypothetical protein
VRPANVLYAPIATGFRVVAGPERLTVQTPTPDTLAPTRIEVFHFNAAIKEPIVTSFGSIPARNALLIRIEDRDGAFGWGEVWQTFRLPELRASCDCSRR